MGPVTGPTASPARLPSFRAPGSGATSIVSIRYGDVSDRNGDVSIGMATYRSEWRRIDRNGAVPMPQRASGIVSRVYRLPSERRSVQGRRTGSRALVRREESSCRPPSRRQSFLSAPEEDAWKRTGGFSDRLADGRDRLTRHIAPHSRRAIAAPGRAPGFRRERARDSAKRSDNRPRPRRSGGSGGTSRPCDRSSASSRRVTG